MVTLAPSRRSKPWGALAEVGAGHCVLASWPLHKPSLTGWHPQQAVVQKGTRKAIFLPGHQDLNCSVCVSGAEVSLKLICGHMNLRPQRTTGSVNETHMCSVAKSGSQKTQRETGTVEGRDFIVFLAIDGDIVSVKQQVFRDILRILIVLLFLIQGGLHSLELKELVEITQNHRRIPLGD